MSEAVPLESNDHSLRGGGEEGRVSTHSIQPYTETVCGWGVHRDSV